MPEDVSRTEGFFGEHAASVYDERAAGMFDSAVVTPVVEMLADLAQDGAALEFGIGTGRIALPLAERGVPVVGIDNSEAMVAQRSATSQVAETMEQLSDVSRQVSEAAGEIASASAALATLAANLEGRAAATAPAG